MSMRIPTVMFADLGSPKVSAYTAEVDGNPVAVVHTAIRDDPLLRQAVAESLTAAGMDPAPLLGALDGFCC